VVAERRITDAAQAEDPVVALRQRAADYAAGDTDLSWTRITGWRTLVAGALDPAGGTVREPVGASITAPATDASAALLAGWLVARLGITPVREDPPAGPGATGLASVQLLLGSGDELSIVRHDGGAAVLQRPGQEDRVLPLLSRTLGEELAEELRRLDADQTYAAALSAAAGVPGLSQRSAGRVHTWVDPAMSPA
jgi:glucose-6-phosphate dehydrogenase assembly protein OpcA